MTLRVGIDVSNACDPRPSGVARYITALVAALARLHDAPDLILFSRLSRLRHGRPGTRFPGHHVRWFADLAPLRGVDVFHAPDLRLPRWAPHPVVATIHDLSALERNDHASPRFLLRKRRAYAHAAERAAALITHTESVRARIIEELGVPPGRVSAIPLADPLRLNGPDLAAAADRAPWLLIVGGPSRRKGSDRLAALLSLWSHALRWTPEIRWVGSTAHADAESFLRRLPARNPVRFLGHVDDGTLDELYRKAMGLLVLSDTEGFGMPLLEAARRSCPVIALASPPLVEVLADGAFWFREPVDGSRATFERFLDPHLRNRTATTALARAQRFTWDETARRTASCYGSVLLTKRRG